jgi:hypothetical protein
LSEGFNEALPAGDDGQRGAEFEAFTVIEEFTELLVGGHVDHRVGCAQEIDQAERRNGLGRQVGAVEIPQGRFHLRLAHALAHQRCAARQTSMHTMVAHFHPQAAAFHGGGLKVGDACAYCSYSLLWCCLSCQGPSTPTS